MHGIAKGPLPSGNRFSKEYKLNVEESIQNFNIQRGWTQKDQQLGSLFKRRAATSSATK